MEAYLSEFELSKLGKKILLASGFTFAAEVKRCARERAWCTWQRMPSHPSKPCGMRCHHLNNGARLERILIVLWYPDEVRDAEETGLHSETKTRPWWTNVNASYQVSFKKMPKANCPGLVVLHMDLSNLSSLVGSNPRSSLTTFLLLQLWTGVAWYSRDTSMCKPGSYPTETFMLEVGVGRFSGPVASYVGIASSRTEISALGPICWALQGLIWHFPCIS